MPFLASFSSLLEEAPIETIIPFSCMVGAARWEVKQVVQGALQEDITPDGCQPDKLFIVPTVRSPVGTLL